MSDEIIVGTVRGRHPDGSHLVVGRDGRPLKVVFRGGRPTVGSDVIGNLAYDDDGRAVMSLHQTVTDAILDGHAKIVPLSKRADLTARVLAKLLERSKSAVFKPGSGMAIERMPQSDDPDIRWAMDAFRPEAERLGLALNVIDVKAVTRSPWDMRSLQNFSLPADIEGTRRSKDELTRILRSGFHPACSRIVEGLTGTNEISVNFVLPYNPFVGAVGFAREVARMDISVFPLCTVDISEARRLSSARQMALAIAHNRLSVGKGFQADVDSHPRVRHLSNCFADAAACLMFLTRGGRPEVVEEYALLRESSLFFGFDERSGQPREGVLETATHRAVRAALEWHATWEAAGTAPAARDVVTRAVRIAKDVALPGVRFAGGGSVTEPEMNGAVNAANMIAADLRTAPRDYLESLSEKYRDDLDALVAEHAVNPVAASRLMSFGAVHVPDRMERLFAEMTAPLVETVRRAAEAEARERGAAAVSGVATRIRSARPGREEVMDFEFDPLPALAIQRP